MANNREIVDRIVGELAQDFKNKLTEVTHDKGLDWHGNADFSDLANKILSALESGQEKNIGLIIDNGVATHLKKWIEGINPTMRKYYSNVFKQITDEMVKYAMKNDKIYADMIVEGFNQNREGEPKQQSFRESLSNFQSEKEEQPQNVSIEEALQKNAQQLYEKTGKVPNGYSLGDDGQVFRDRKEEGQQMEEQPENSKKDAEMEK